MAPAARLARLDGEREALERSYREALVAALNDCVQGRWGLFGQNEAASSLTSNRYLPESARRVDAIGGELIAVRRRLGFAELFPPMGRLLELRIQKGSNVLGEARLAEQFLQELAE